MYYLDKVRDSKDVRLDGTHLQQYYHRRSTIDLVGRNTYIHTYNTPSFHLFHELRKSRLMWPESVSRGAYRMGLLNDLGYGT
jgi:hypothetical protein